MARFGLSPMDCVAGKGVSRPGCSGGFAALEVKV
jgi:hypothetical protein